MQYIFQKEGTTEFIKRIKNLNTDTPALWGKMNVAQMLAHCSYAYEDTAPMPNFFTRLLIRFSVKNTVVGNKPYKRNMPTSSAFIINSEREFEMEKKKLTSHLEKLQELGTPHFKNRKHPVFGKLTLEQWHNSFAKHLDHHLGQFGV